MTTAVGISPISARPTISSGTQEALKWIAAVAMVIDHINTYLLDGGQAWMYDIGRLAMPMFGFVLAYNLANIAQEKISKLLSRLLIAATVSCAPFWALGHPFWMLNILFLYAIATLCICMVDTPNKDGRVAAFLCAGVTLLVLGALVEFWWPGIIFTVAAWSYCKRGGIGAATLLVGATASLATVNDNSWALMVLPVIFFAPALDIRCPRIKHLFYLFYPAHLSAILLLSR